PHDAARLRDLQPFPTRRSSDLADQRTEWSALAGLLAGGLGDAPGLAGAPPGALAGLAMLDSDLQTRFRATAPGIPIGEALGTSRSEEHTSELQSRFDLVCRPLL